MIQRRRRARFELETAQMIGISAGSRADKLQRDIAPQSFIARPKNFAHGSRADFFDNSIMPDELARHAQPRWHVRVQRRLPSITESTACREAARRGVFSDDGVITAVL